MELDKILEEQIGEELYQIVLSNPKNPDKLAKVKIRPVMLQERLYYQKTSYIGTKVFHENLEKQQIIKEILLFLQQDFKQMTLESIHTSVTVLVSKKGKMTIKNRTRSPRQSWLANRCFPITGKKAISWKKARRFLF